VTGKRRRAAATPRLMRTGSAACDWAMPATNAAAFAPWSATRRSGRPLIAASTRRHASERRISVATWSATVAAKAHRGIEV